MGRLSCSVGILMVAATPAAAMEDVKTSRSVTDTGGVGEMKLHRPAAPLVNGSIVLNSGGARMVLALRGARHELWRIDDTGAVVDVGYFSPRATGIAESVRIQWTVAGPEEAPLLENRQWPWRGTAERFAAFRLSDWLIAESTTRFIALPFMERNAGFKFRAGGELIVPLTVQLTPDQQKEGLPSTREIIGAWWWSGGSLHIQVPGIAEVGTYEWRALAQTVNWDDDPASPALVQNAAVLEPPAEPVGGREKLPPGATACPRGIIRDLLATAVDRADVVTALGIERDTLALCKQRQEIVAQIVGLEEKISKIVEKEAGEDEASDPPLTSLAQLAEFTPPPPPAEEEVLPPAPEPPPPSYSWFSLLGRKGQLLAGVTDGSARWFVSVGDVLPGDHEVIAINARPPAVRVAGIGPLPWTGAASTTPQPAPSSEIIPPQRASAKRAVARPSPERVTVLDGDTIRRGRERIRLWGIDAPEKGQVCRADGKEWPCGALATEALRSRSAGLDCSDVRGKDRWGRTIAVCLQRGEDVNAWLVRQGWALAYRQFSADYVPAERQARAARSGMHRGEFVAPWDWRAGTRLDSEPVMPAENPNTAPVR